MPELTSVHSSILKRFCFLNATGHLAHAYLLIGPKGVGKSEIALEITALLFCETKGNEKESPCGVCPSCVKMRSSHHPDFQVIEALDGETIKIEQIRELLNRVALRPFWAAKKVFVIKNIEQLTSEAANALLKTLEEPTSSTLLLLTTSVFSKVLDTIKSRCHWIYFHPLSQRHLQESLMRSQELDASKAQVVSFLAGGSLRKASGLLTKGGLDRRDEVIDRFIFALEKESFLKKIIGEKERMREFLDILLSWIRDAFFLKAGMGKRFLGHVDRLDDLNRFHAQLSFEQLVALNREVVKTYALLMENFNMKIPFMILKEKLWVKP